MWLALVDRKATVDKLDERLVAVCRQGDLDRGRAGRHRLATGGSPTEDHSARRLDHQKGAASDGRFDVQSEDPARYRIKLAHSPIHHHQRRVGEVGEDHFRGCVDAHACRDVVSCRRRWRSRMKLSSCLGLHSLIALDDLLESIERSGPKLGEYGAHRAQRFGVECVEPTSAIAPLVE